MTAKRPALRLVPGAGAAGDRAEPGARPQVIAPPRRGLNRVEAAAYIGVGTTKFDALVAEGRMPKPKRIDGRRVWDIRALDSAFDELPDEGAANPWDA